MNEHPQVEWPVEQLRAALAWQVRAEEKAEAVEVQGPQGHSHSIQADWEDPIANGNGSNEPGHNEHHGSPSHAEFLGAVSRGPHIADHDPWYLEMFLTMIFLRCWISGQIAL